MHRKNILYTTLSSRSTCVDSPHSPLHAPILELRRVESILAIVAHLKQLAESISTIFFIDLGVESPVFSELHVEPLYTETGKQH